MWFLIPIAGLLIAGIVALVSEDEKEARESWENKYESAKREVKKHQKIIQQHLDYQNAIFDFYVLNESYYSSYRTADSAFKLLNDSKVSLSALHKMLDDTNKKRADIKAELDSNPPRTEKVALIGELRNLTEFRGILQLDRDKVLVQKRELADEVSRLNKQTENLKVVMRDKCGIKGVEWHTNLQERLKLKT